MQVNQEHLHLWFHFLVLNVSMNQIIEGRKEYLLIDLLLRVNLSITINNNLQERILYNHKQESLRVLLMLQLLQLQLYLVSLLIYSYCYNSICVLNLFLFFNFFNPNNFLSILFLKDNRNSLSRSPSMFGDSGSVKVS